MIHYLDMGLFLLLAISFLIAFFNTHTFKGFLIKWVFEFIGFVCAVLVGALMAGAVYGIILLFHEEHIEVDIILTLGEHLDTAFG